MEELKLNETPVRTSRNYNINNIKLENINIPKKIKEFKNVLINQESKKDIIDINVSDINLKYGLNHYLTEQIKNNSNKKIRININSKTDKKIEIKFNFDEHNINLVENIEIIANEDTKSNILIKYESNNDIEFYHNGNIRIIGKENSQINITILNLLNTKSNNLICYQNELQKNSKLNYNIIDFGGKNSISNYYSDLLEKKSENNINTIYLGIQNQLFDLNYIVELKGEKTNTNIDIQGALKDNAIKHFKGTIDFKKGSKKSQGNEEEFCMLLSDKAKSIALPMLLCDEEDITGNHSTSSGKIDEAQLFYIMSRGFSYKEARKLIVKARFNKIIEKISDDNLKNEILNKIDEILD